MSPCAVSPTLSTTVQPKSDRLTVGFLTHGLWDAYGQALWHGVIDAASAADANVLCFPGGDLRQERETPEAQANVVYDLVGSDNVDGLVLSGSPLSNFVGLDGFQQFCDRFYGLALTIVSAALPSIPSVLLDNYQGMREAVAHLIEAHGCRRIAFLPGPSTNPEAIIRYQAYCNTLQEYGLPLDPALVASPGAWNHASGWQAVEELLDQRQARFEALVSANDGMAIGALDALQSRGISVPDEVLLTGFGDGGDVQILTPPFTTVRQPSYEQARQATQLVIARLRGEPTPEETNLPTHLVVRQSCGCLESYATRAENVVETASTQPFASAFAASQKVVWHELAQLLEAGSARAQEWARRFTSAFIGEITGESPGQFLRALNQGLSYLNAASRSVSEGEDALAILRRHATPYLHGAERSRADDLWQQARLFIAATAKRQEQFHTWQQKEYLQAVRQIEGALITTFDLHGICEVLTAALPRLGIPSCYVALYESPGNASKPDEQSSGAKTKSAEAPLTRIPSASSLSQAQARLILAYHDGHIVELPADGLLFPAHQLAPPELFPRNRRYNLVVEPLYFRTEQLGFALFEVGPRDGSVYEGLRTTLSSALQGALLLQRVKAHAAEIAEQKYILETFMANVPDNIYFKDRDSRFTQVNPALANRLGVSPAELIGKSDFDFFSPDQAQPKYDQEQAIIQSGQALLNQEEPNAGGGWALTTKMPLRDAAGQVIGTFGISRDITPLKQAQMEIAAAYEEIRLLNTRLQQENLRMSAELDVSRRIQQMILPQPEELQQIEGLDIVGYMQPADEVGGDYYDVLNVNDMTHIGIGDVTGHGLESGILMLMVQTAIRTLIEHGETDPVTFLSTLNRVVMKNASRMHVDKTLTLAFVNYQQGLLKIAGQHEDLLLVRRGGQVERVDTLDLGFPLGLEEDIARFVAEATITLGPGDGVVLYTDGITEAESPEGELYGLERLCTTLSRHWEQPAEAIKQTIVADVMRHIDRRKVLDDLTLVILKQK